jgi:hypothetical protein
MNPSSTSKRGREREGRGTGLTNPTANVKLFFSGLASSTNFLTEAEEVSLGNNLCSNVLLPFPSSADSIASPGLLGLVVEVEAEAIGSEGFNVDPPGLV